MQKNSNKLCTTRKPNYHYKYWSEIIQSRQTSAIRRRVDKFRLRWITTAHVAKKLRLLVERRYSETLTDGAYTSPISIYYLETTNTGRAEEGSLKFLLETTPFLLFTAFCQNGVALILAPDPRIFFCGAISSMGRGAPFCSSLQFCCSAVVFLTKNVCNGYLNGLQDLGNVK